MIFRELYKIREKSSTTKEDMIIPTGYVFRPTDEELLIHYLDRKCKHLSLPCNVVFERQIYGVGDKAPWQIFTKDDPWTENTVYVYTRLIKVTKNGDRVARTAGCGTWHAETGLECVTDDEGGVIGSKKTLCFRINNEPGVIDEEGERRGHWIMHEYSLGDGKSSAGKGEYVLCRIRRVDKDPKKSVSKAKNVEAGSVDDDVAVPKPAKRAYSLEGSKSSTGKGESVLCKIKRNASRFTKKSVRKAKNVSVRNAKNVEAGSVDDDVVVRKPPKRARTEFVPEQKLDCDIAAELETEVVPLSEDLFVQELDNMTGGDPNLMFDLEEFVALLEEDRQGSYSPRHCNSAAPVRSDHTTAISNPNFNIAAKYFEELEPVVEQQQGFPLDFDAFGNISSTTEVVPSGLASVPEMAQPPKSFDDEWNQYLSPKLIECWGENISNTEISVSAEVLPRYQESNRFLPPHSGFDATTEPPSLISSVSNNMHVQLEPETIEGLKNMSWSLDSFPHGYGGEIDLLQSKEWS
ncbi:uncharacterized protein LOC131302830 [Rhododendron vialii]|uniref:uncharacterized protein LOC131302830 n=1 Tax=Rhododendron vialii TaxID=182163 RepID=UPI00265F45FD|nr:uncharacterized protein LOC131302830 [Rhododendron vialii]